MVAPVRETCAQALGAVLKHMHPSLVCHTLNILLQMQVCCSSHLSRPLKFENNAYSPSPSLSVSLFFVLSAQARVGSSSWEPPWHQILSCCSPGNLLMKIQ